MAMVDCICGRALGKARPHLKWGIAMRLIGFPRCLGTVGTFILFALVSFPVQAQITESARYASVVIEARSGNLLSAANGDEIRHPASLTKMMTLYLLFEAMRAGRLDLGSPVRFSVNASSQPPSKLGVPAGGTISVETAILSLVTRSANDVASAVGEMLGGDEDNFARMMTQRARSLGMTRTTFRNASGLPDPEQVTTARDMALLGRRLFLDYPDRYAYFATTHFAHGRRVIRNHNGMLHDYPGTDGIKTGFINASGFNIVTSAQRDGVRLVGAVFGGNSWSQRNSHMADLLDDGFERMGVRRVPTLNPPAAITMARAPREAVAPRREAAAPRQDLAGPRRGNIATRQVPTPQAQGSAGSSARTITMPPRPQPRLVATTQPRLVVTRPPRRATATPTRATPARPPARAAQPTAPRRS